MQTQPLALLFKYISQVSHHRISSVINISLYWLHKSPWTVVYFYMCYFNFLGEKTTGPNLPVAHPAYTYKTDCMGVLAT
jgi:hypothetical protein